MCEIRRKYDAEFKKNAVKLSYASSKSVREVADDLGINDGMLYRWRRRYTADGNKTVFAARDEELKKLRPKNEKRRPASRHKGYSAAKRAGFLHVSLSGYNAWKKNRAIRENQAARLEEKVSKIFKDNGGKYGAKSRGDVFPNLTKDMYINAPFQALSSDINYVKAGEGFDYLCRIKDIVSGVMLGWSVSQKYEK